MSEERVPGADNPHGLHVGDEYPVTDAADDTVGGVAAEDLPPSFPVDNSSNEADDSEDDDSEDDDSEDFDDDEDDEDDEDEDEDDLDTSEVADSDE